MDGQARVRRLPPRGRSHPRAHPREAVARGPLGHPHPQGQAADHGGHLHRAPRHRHREVRRRGRRAAARAARDHEEERPHQHQRDQAAGARREARRAVDRGAAREPRELPARDEALARLCDALRRSGHQDHRGRPARRRRDEPARDVLRGTRPAAHDPRGHRLRPGRGEDDLRHDRRQGLGQQGRDHARGLRRSRRARHAPRRPGSGSPATRRLGRGSRRIARGTRTRGQDREGLGIVPRKRRGAAPRWRAARAAPAPRPAGARAAGRRGSPAGRARGAGRSSAGGSVQDAPVQSSAPPEATPETEGES